MQSFVPGMYVRFALDITDEHQDFRDFRLGHILQVDPLAAVAQIQYDQPRIGKPTEHLTCERPLRQIYRCRILAGSPCTYQGHLAHVLCAAAEDWTEGQFMEYFVMIDGSIIQVSERDLVASATRQDVDPWQQLISYEFHPPRWRFLRNQVVTCVSELKNMTFGLEDLVGSRIALLAHQAEVVATVLSDPACRYILADEVGLGKTIETCVILKGLRRRDPQMKALIIAPAALIPQWYHELYYKFWLPVASSNEWLTRNADAPIVMISTEDLHHATEAWIPLMHTAWDLLIVDEAHHIHKEPHLYDRIQTLSSLTSKTLILSATPIQQRATEYLYLLQLLDPDRYAELDESGFQKILAIQDRIRRTIAYLQPTLTHADFDGEEFEEEIEPLLRFLADDPVLPRLMERLHDEGLGCAVDIIAYISENYRLEHRVIRNRRASLVLDLPQRKGDMRYAYHPSHHEIETLDRLYEYVQYTLDAIPTPVAVEYGRVLLSAGASSPDALLAVLKERLIWLEQSKSQPMLNQHSVDPWILRVASPRTERVRITKLLQALPSFPDEQELLDSLQWSTTQWMNNQHESLQRYRRVEIDDQRENRLGAAILAIRDTLAHDSSQKTLLFSSWSETIDSLVPQLARLFGHEAVVTFRHGMDERELQQAADYFQENDSCVILVCDELGGEGRNFQIAEQIIHLDIPWTPAHIEQRIGRVDRLGRRGTVHSIVPYAHDTLEHDLVRIWHDAFHLFDHSMSGMEIALEETLDHLAQALQTSVRDGLRLLLPRMLQQITHLREVVEEERYFEEGAINKRLRQQFTTLNHTYSDGHILGKAFVQWANIAGARVFFNSRNQRVTFNPLAFNDASMANAKFIPPNMEEAHRRSERMNTLQIEGTFNRHIAIQQERLVFFAPGDDPWTDALITNAFESDRGRCCAEYRKVAHLDRSWYGFELLYRVLIDPRPLYAAGYHPTHLFRSQGFLSVATISVVVDRHGEILKRSHPICEELRTAQENPVHLGKRSNPARLTFFKKHYPPDMWHDMVAHTRTCAEHYLATEFSFTDELADEALAEFQRRAAGWRAAHRRLFSELTSWNVDPDIAAFEQASTALVDGLRHPIFRLESACFWLLEPESEHQ